MSTTGNDGAAILAAPSETFEFTLVDGSVITVGKPQTIFKMRLRRMLGDSINDQELMNIATAFLSIRFIRNVGQVPGQNRPFDVPLNTEIQFEGFMSRFGTDEKLDEFMNHYSRMVNAAGFAMAQEVIQEGIKKGLTGKALEQYIQEKAIERSFEATNEVRDSLTTPAS